MNLFASFQRKTALVIGDFMLDVYVRGHVQRISPEAPVPVLCVEQEESRPGGAGNAILNLISLGLQVTAIGRVGDDESGRAFVSSLQSEGVDCRHIYFEKGWHTPIKKRMIADNQQLLRVDHEDVSPLSSTIEEKILAALPSLIEGKDVVAISDYAKGLLSDRLLQAIITCCNEKKVPVVVDPKGMNFMKYRGATLIKPNMSEAIAASRLDRKSSLDEIGKRILEEIGVTTLMITRSKDGITIFSQTEGRCDFPAAIHEVKDVTGAGDTVLAVITATLANRVDLKVGAQLANVAAGIAIERIGCARITLAELAARMQKN